MNQSGFVPIDVIVIVADKPFLMAMTSICSFGVLLSLVALIALLASKPKLVKLEFNILLTLNAITLFYRVSAVAIFLVTYFMYPEIMYNCAFSIVNLLWTVIMFKVFMVTFYYSLYQVSSCSRHPFCRRLHGLIHSLRNFVIYQALVVILVTLILTYIVLVAYADLNECPSALDLLNYMILFKFITTYVLPSLLPVLAYSIAILLVFFTRLNNKKSALGKSNQNGSKRARKDLKLLLRFFVLGLICTLSSLLQNVYLFSTFFESISQPLNSIVGILGFFINAIQPLIWIYIHSILKESFLTLVSRFFYINRK